MAVTLNRIMRKLASTRKKVQRQLGYDEINVSDDIRRPATNRYLIRVRNIFEKALRGIEVDPILETDFNEKAFREYDDHLKLEAVEDGSYGNLISFEIIDGATGGAAEVVLEDSHILIQIEDGVTDYDTVLAALQAEETVSSLVTASLIGTGTDIVPLTESLFLQKGD